MGSEGSDKTALLSHSRISLLLSQSELANDRTVTLNVRVLEIIEQVSSVTDHLLKTATAMEILLVSLEVGGQIVDAGSQNCDLNFGRTGISFVGCVLLDQAELFVFLHGIFHLSLFFWRFTQQSVGE